MVGNKIHNISKTSGPKRP